MGTINFKNKPLGWYYHRALCWFGWKVRHIDNWNVYYHHLNKMLNKYKINYYGEKY